VTGCNIRSPYPKGVFDNNAAAALVKWKWEATEQNINKNPVLTSVRLDFMSSKNANNAKLLKNCPKRNV
jgi:hypothetical protein